MLCTLYLFSNNSYVKSELHLITAYQTSHKSFAHALNIHYIIWCFQKSNQNTRVQHHQKRNNYCHSLAAIKRQSHLTNVYFMMK